MSALVDAIAACLFGRRAGCGAVGNADLRQLGAMNAGGYGFCVVEQFGQAEVEHLHLSRRRDHDITRLDISMNDASTVSGGERVGDLHAD